ncbi:mechanosensitive ion channel family protein [Pseudoxanthomonas dokdonensis]|uniref:mechanosensitive ion channel family protein n=1 Tax=Pseudoxanthomonas dokdonensis TaxID=344882 RepID=UPI00070E420B|nr:mechanosensitive ion channel domain-containing protein [Pseudoxanthomonas dokdonensis]
MESGIKIRAPYRSLLSCRLRAFLAVTALTLCAMTAQAQDAASKVEAAVTPAATTAPDAAPSIISVMEIPARADGDEQFAEQVQLLASSQGHRAQLSQQLDVISRSVNGKIQAYTQQKLRSLPVLRLESLERHWAFDERRYQRWRDDLKDATAPYTDAAAGLDKRSAAWEATLAADGPDAMASALRDRATSVLKQLQQAEQALSVPLSNRIALGHRGNIVSAQIKAGRQSVVAAIDHIDSRLLHVDAAPIWAVPASDKQQSMTDSVVDGVAVEANFLRDYNASGLGNQRAREILQLLLLPLLLWLTYRSRKAQAAQLATSPSPPPGEDQPDGARRVLARPLSAWLLLSMLVLFLLEPEAPLLLHQIALLVAMIPAIRLLPPRVFQLVGPWPYAAAGFYLLERLAFLFTGSNFLYRSYLLGLTITALLATVWLLWRSRHRPMCGLQGRAGQAVLAAALACVAVLTISALCNVFGNVSLAEVLTTALLDSGYLGLVLFATYFVSMALLRAFTLLPGVRRMRIVRLHSEQVLYFLSRLMGVLAVLGWVVFTLNRFRVFRPIYAALHGALSHAFEIGEISLSIGHVLLFVVSVLIAFWAAKLVRFLLHEEVLTHFSLPRGVSNSISTLTYYAIIILGLVLGLAAAGLKIGQLAFVFGALGVGIGFGLQNVVNNFVSGLILMFERPIQPGDVVDVAGASGTISEIGMRATTLKTFEGADVVVPNGTLLSGNLTNWTLLDRNRRMEVQVGVAYGSRPDQVSDLLLEVAKATPGVASYPEPYVLFNNIGASSLEFLVRAWTHDYDNWVIIRSQMVARIYNTLGQAGIELAFPQQDLHLRSISADAGQWLASPASSRTDAGASRGAAGQGSGQPRAETPLDKPVDD